MCTVKATHYKDPPKVMICSDVVNKNEEKQRYYQTNTPRFGGQQGWIYSVNGLMSTIPASGYKDPPKIVVIDEKRKCDEQDNSDRKHER